MAIVLDASYLIALFNESDMHHEHAERVAEDVTSGKYGESMTSDDVLDEAIGVIKRKKGMEDAKSIARNIAESMFIFCADNHLLDNSLNLFYNQDGNFSFTDCSSIAIMNSARIECIATFDKEFKKTNIKVID